MKLRLFAFALTLVCLLSFAGVALAQDAAPVNIEINYSGSPGTIVPGGFYLFANTTTVSLAWGDVTADAVWESAVGGPNETNFTPRFVTTVGSENFNVIPVSEDGIASAAGGVRLFDIGTGQVWDTVGWTGNGSHLPGALSYETTAISQMVGFQRNELYACLLYTSRCV